MDVRPEQYWKASHLIPVTPLGIIVFLHPTINTFDKVSIIALQLSRESNTVLPISTDMVVRLEQSDKTREPILVTLLGIVTDFKLEQPLKAPDPRFVTLLGMVMEFKPVQYPNLYLIVAQTIIY